MAADRDTWYDRFLDFLSCHRFPAFIEWIAAYITFGCVLTYYGWIHVQQQIICYQLFTRYSPALMITPRVDTNDDAKVNLEQLLDSINQCFQAHCNISNNITTLTSDGLVIVIRQHAPLRRLVSDFYRVARSPTSPRSAAVREFCHRLETVWDDLLVLPEPLLDYQPNSKNEYLLSLIVPVHNESKERLRRTLQHAWQTCHRPRDVQVVVVATTKDFVLPDLDLSWGDTKSVFYTAGGGRGPTLNCGAAAASGRILTFLHADVLLPSHWDVSIVRALRTAPVCAFAIGMDWTDVNTLPFPFGVSAVTFMDDLRSRWFQMPYGDQIISLPAATFFYIGGYPSQPIMEDYELMDFFRQRSLSSHQSGVGMLRDTVQHSPRRYQAKGVTYVMLCSALLVYRYLSRGWTPQQVFDYYYLRTSRQKSPKSE